MIKKKKKNYFQNRANTNIKQIRANEISFSYLYFVHFIKNHYLLTSSSCHPKFFVKEFCYFLMSCHQHCLGINLLVQR